MISLIVLIVGAMVYAIASARQSGLKDQQIRDLNQTVKAVKTRDEIDHEVSQDVHLADRARSDGLVRTKSP